MHTIQLRLRIPDPRPHDQGSTVRVAVRDTTLADTLHPTVAEVTGLVADGDGVELSVDLASEPLHPRHRYSVWGHVDHAGDGELRPGDLITTQDVPVGLEDVDAGPVEVPLTRI